MHCKKTKKYLNANIFVVFHFTEKQKKVNSVFAIVDIRWNFQKNWLKEMAVIGHPGPCDICTQIYYKRGVD